MNIIHTADWHLGQTFFGYERIREHEQFLEWLKQTLNMKHIDLLLISGDIFDSPNPSAETQRMFYRFLKEATEKNPEMRTVIISGNHDSAARLEAPNPLLEDINITVRGIIKHTDGEIDYDHFIVPIKNPDTASTVWCMAIPYLRQGDYPSSKENDEYHYATGVRNMYKNVFNKINSKKKKKDIIIAMGHLQATGSEISDKDRSERTVIGGLECIAPDIFDTDITYTALGHLHKAQRVSKRENVRYSGSPLPMSFAEKNYNHGVTYIKADSGTTPYIEHLVFDAPVKLISIPSKPKKLQEVLDELKQLPEGDLTGNSPYIEVNVLITGPEPSMKYQIEEALRTKSVRLARISGNTLSTNTQTPATHQDLQELDPITLAKEFYKKQYDTKMSDELIALLSQIIKEEQE